MIKENVRPLKNIQRKERIFRRARSKYKGLKEIYLICELNLEVIG